MLQGVPLICPTDIPETWMQRFRCICAIKHRRPPRRARHEDATITLNKCAIASFSSFFV